MEKPVSGPTGMGWVGRKGSCLLNKSLAESHPPFPGRTNKGQTDPLSQGESGGEGCACSQSPTTTSLLPPYPFLVHAQGGLNAQKLVGSMPCYGEGRGCPCSILALVGFTMGTCRFLSLSAAPLLDRGLPRGSARGHSLWSHCPSIQSPHPSPHSLSLVFG